ncbi:post-GPI attachment to proteins factor 2-like [Contarinia nasturtii]|uniref:post-GPI attachment to proteins factor 2-like n=1 Tax=Contarinia nasturtii TaxID=265458 RepID=UPI0012D46A6B|nr:post-GPI attachment to proteins factor 2-like [Contarinia nasturtii]
MTIDKNEPDEIPANQKDESPNSKEITEKITVHFMLGFREICMVTAALPMVTLFICFVSAVVFQFDDVHETHCRVFNFIPSISAITGISPNIYFWRISIALHVGPRFIIAICYKSYYEHMLCHVKNPIVHSKGTLYMKLAFWLHIVEITSLCGVTYISNRENYTLHEQVFIVFMVCSLCHMLIVIKLCQLLKNEIDVQRLPHLILIDEEKSIKFKKILFNISIVCTVGLAVFFFKHRVYCHDLAFSAFAFCEYIIAVCNLAFHCTTMLDFPSEYLMIARRTTKLKLKHPTGWKLD